MREFTTVATVVFVLAVTALVAGVWFSVPHRSHAHRRRPRSDEATRRR